MAIKIKNKNVCNKPSLGWPLEGFEGEFQKSWSVLTTLKDKLEACPVFKIAYFAGHKFGYHILNTVLLTRAILGDLRRLETQAINFKWSSKRVPA